jgi:hypothetical protein
MKLSSRHLPDAISCCLAFIVVQNLLAHAESGKSNNNTSPSFVAGFRAAYKTSKYPDYQFPNAEYWTTAGKTLAAKFDGANAAAIWIVSLYLDNGCTQLGFPSIGKRFPYISFAPADYSEEHLSHFDSTGVKVWLQIEPGAANVETLIDLVLDRYGHHQCVVGLGIDVEWHHAQTHAHGRKISDAEARRWEQHVQSHNPAYRLFLKHYGQAWMPPLYRGNILFIDDSQQFYSLDAMVGEFRMWGEKFHPNQVAFQFGYPADKPWWGALADPAAAVGKALLAEIPNAYGLFWVDFTLSQIFPSTPMAKKKSLVEKGISQENFSEADNSEELLPTSASSVEPSFTLVQNYLNSLQQTIDIVLNVPQPSHVRVEVFDGNGRFIDYAVDKAFPTGEYRVQWNPPQRNRMKSWSGLYYYSMKTTRRTITKSLLLNEPNGEKPRSDGIDQNSPRSKR